MKRIVILLAVMCVLPSFSQANVSLRNGNFFIGYTDLIYPGGFEPKIERVYNSKTPYQGIFGWGWGTEYEAYISIALDGSLLVNEYGGGAQNRFYPKNFKAEDLDAAIKRLAEVAKKSGALGSEAQLASYTQKLKNDAIFRNAEWDKFRSQGKIKPVSVKTGTQFFSSRFSYQMIAKVNQGYQRGFENGKVELFDSNGRLIRVSDKNNNSLSFKYGKDGNLISAIDNFNRKILFSFNSKGFVEKIEGENGKKAFYKYNNNGELTDTKDVDGNTYQYAYDDRHNMTKIGYTDKTAMEIAYHPRSENENVKSVRDRDGTLTEYTYDNKKSDGSHLLVSLKMKNKEGKEFSTSSYEYVMKTKPTGEQWTYRMVATVDGLSTDTTYNEELGLPVEIKKGGDVSRFKYDAKGHVIEKDTPLELVKLSYDPKVGKVSRVVRVSKLGDQKGQQTWSEFQYDKGNGNLLFAKNSSKQGVKLLYDRNGRISSMVDQTKRVIAFKYNENSKPVEIRDPKLGSIRVKYKNSGEVAGVESTAGRQIALQVTSAFQNLLDIVRPAGVTLSF